MYAHTHSSTAASATFLSTTLLVMMLVGYTPANYAGMQPSEKHMHRTMSLVMKHVEQH